jgi:DNA-directed RNA polymerase subunit H (RpoH/RPB5)
MSSSIFIPDDRVKTLHVSTTQVGNDANTNEKTLWTYSLPANTLNADGKGVRITVFGIVASNTNNKALSVAFGSTSTPILSSVAANNGSWRIVIDVLRVSATAQVMDVFGNVRAASLDTQVVTVLAPGETLVNTVVIKVIGQSPTTGAANDVVVRGAIVEAIG